MRTEIVSIALVACAVLCAGDAGAAAPEGYLDSAEPELIGGWARDADYPFPIPVHIYIDGEMAHDMLANGFRPDLPFPDQDHGYTWIPPRLGHGTHEVIAYAIGVDANGVPDGENVGLTGSPGIIADGCTGLQEPALTWCNGVPPYYENRAADTEYLYSSDLRAGVNTSYGGVLFELYASDHAFNVISEHGGGAVQLSIWGYEPVGPDAWFGQGSGVCDPTAFSSEADCLAAGHASCRLWCCSQGAHVPDCSTVHSCVDWGAGAPFNPIQAQAESCGWHSPTNDVDQLSTGSGWVTTRKDAPYHFTQTDAMPGVSFEQTTSIHEAYVQLDFRITYTGPYTLGEHPQEIPAVFPAWGMNHSYHYYAGPTPYADPHGPVTTVTQPASGLMLRIEDRDPYPHGWFDDTLTEFWVSACDAAAAHCLTLAVFSGAYKEIDAAAYPGTGYGYLTPLGGFAIVPGLDVEATAYLFPYRYDQTVGGQTVREWIFDLASQYPLGDDDDATGDDDDATGDDDDATGDDDTAGDDDATGDDDTGGDDDTAGDDDTGGDDDGPPGPGSRDSRGGCSCEIAPGPRWPALGVLLLAALARRRG